MLATPETAGRHEKNEVITMVVTCQPGEQAEASWESPQGSDPDFGRRPLSPSPKCGECEGGGYINIYREKEEERF